MNAPVTFTVEHQHTGSLARAGVIHTPHGDVETPAFVVVGTKATVKGVKPDDLFTHAGATMLLANTYHLFLSPGEDTVRDAGGLQSFAQWPCPTMTDSGGFQVFSLGAAFGKGVTKFAQGDLTTDHAEGLTPYQSDHATAHGKLCIVDEDGVTFTSHIDGSMHRFTAERSIEIQHKIGADIIVAFDECTSPTAPYEYQREAMERTHRWAKRSLLAHKQNYTALTKQGLYGVVQGGRFLDLREESARYLGNMEFDGYGIGGSFSKADLGESLRVVNAVLPPEKPRHLLGIGEPEDIIAGVRMGCDTFDCVAPTRIGRTGTVYTTTSDGYDKIDLRSTRYARDFGKLDPHCSCYVCTHFTRAYLSHLFRSHEMLGPELASLHNLAWIISFTATIRKRILDGTFE